MLSNRTRLSAVAAVLACATVSALGTASAQAAEPSVIGNWTLDASSAGTTADSAGAGLTGTGVAATNVPGKFGSAFKLQADGDGFRVSAAPALQPGSVTVLAWVNSVVNPGGFRTLLALGGRGRGVTPDACNDTAYGLTTAAGGGVQFRASVTSGVVHTYSATTAADPAKLWDGQWHAIAGTFEAATSKLTIWVDGQSVGTATAPAAAIDYAFFPVRDLVVGHYPNADCDPADTQYKGSIDDVRVYDRALTAAELAYLHDPAATAPRFLPVPSGESPLPSTPATPETPAPAAPAAPTGLRAIPAGSVKLSNGSKAAPAPLLAEALGAANAQLSAVFATPPKASQIVKKIAVLTSKQANAVKPDAKVERALDALEYGMPVKVAPPAGAKFVEVAGTIAVQQKKRSGKVETTTVTLPPAIVPASAGAVVAQLPVDRKAIKALTDDQVSKAAVALKAVSFDAGSGGLSDEQLTQLQPLSKRYDAAAARAEKALTKLAKAGSSSDPAKEKERKEAEQKVEATEKTRDEIMQELLERMLEVIRQTKQKLQEMQELVPTQTTTIQRCTKVLCR